MHLDDDGVLGDGRGTVVLDVGQRLGACSAERRGRRCSKARSPPPAQHTDPESGAVLRGTFYELFETQRERALELDPFTSALQELLPYRQFGATWSRPLGKRWDLDLGADIRRVRDDADVGEFNRDWERWRATVTAHDFGVRGLAVSVTMDRWDGDARDTSTWGADATYRPVDAWRFARERVRALRVRPLRRARTRRRALVVPAREHDATRALTLDLAYEYEDAATETYQFLRWGASWRF